MTAHPLANRMETPLCANSYVGSTFSGLGPGFALSGGHFHRIRLVGRGRNYHKGTQCKFRIFCTGIAEWKQP